MGDIAEMTLEGILCEGCGEYIGYPVGYPRYCAACSCANNEPYWSKRNEVHKKNKAKRKVYKHKRPIRPACN